MKVSRRQRCGWPSLWIPLARAPVTAPNENPAQLLSGRGLGNPHREGINLCYEGSAKEIHRRGKSSSRNVRHDQPIVQRRPYCNARTRRFGARLSLFTRALLWGVG
jgi:hypothetical protein